MAAVSVKRSILFQIAVLFKALHGSKGPVRNQKADPRKFLSVQIFARTRVKGVWNVQLVETSLKTCQSRVYL